jgi:hypothetical protein
LKCRFNVLYRSSRNIECKLLCVFNAGSGNLAWDFFSM